MLRPPKVRSAWARLFAQFHNVLIYVLLAAGIVTLLLGHVVDASVIVAVVAINAVIGFLQEGKAERALMRYANCFRRRRWSCATAPVSALPPKTSFR